MPPTLTLIGQQLRTLERDPVVIGLRAAGLAAVALVMLTELSGSGVASDRPGRDLLDNLLGSLVWLLPLVGIVAIAPAIPRAIEDRRIELIRMTPLSSLGVAAALIVPIAAAMLTVLVAIVPILLLCVTLGGVTPWEVIGGFATALAWSTLVAVAATTVSAWTTHPQQAVIRASLLWLGILAALSSMQGLAGGWDLFVATPQGSSGTFAHPPRSPVLLKFVGAVAVVVTMLTGFAILGGRRERTTVAASDSTRRAVEPPRWLSDPKSMTPRRDRRLLRDPVRIRDRWLVTGRHWRLLATIATTVVIAAAGITIVRAYIGAGPATGWFSLTLVLMFSYLTECGLTGARAVSIDRDQWGLLQLTGRESRSLLRSKLAATRRRVAIAGLLFAAMMLAEMAPMLVGPSAMRQLSMFACAQVGLFLTSGIVARRLAALLAALRVPGAGWIAAVSGFAIYAITYTTLFAIDRQNPISPLKVSTAVAVHLVIAFALFRATAALLQSRS